MNTKRKVVVPNDSLLSIEDYTGFLENAAKLLKKQSIYFAESEGIDSLELAHILPRVPESLLAIYVGINDAVCNKGLVAQCLLNHAHNNVFVFDPAVHKGDSDVPSGCIDAKGVVADFTPPNESWPKDWTYVMIADSERTVQSLWEEKGYIDTISAKLEDFTVLTDFTLSKVCVFVDPKAFEHPVNMNRSYLRQARKLGEKMVSEFTIPDYLVDEYDGLVPVVLQKGEKLYIANSDYRPCAHGWLNTHPDNKEYAVINENSAVPLDLITKKPPLKHAYQSKLKPAFGSADLTTDWHKRGKEINRKPLLTGAIQG